jgi:hypothetical protein
MEEIEEEAPVKNESQISEPKMEKAESKKMIEVKKEKKKPSKI